MSSDPKKPTKKMASPKKAPAKKAPAKKAPAKKAPAKAPKPPKAPKTAAPKAPRPAAGWKGRAGVWLGRLRTALLWWMFIGVTVPIIQVALLNVIDPPLTLTMLSRGVEARSETGEFTMPAYEWIDITEIPDHTISAAISSEDARFLEHSGFDWDAIEDAWAERATGGTAGGSTISQQTAKNVFLWQSRSWLRKGLEVWYTFWLEKLVSKKRIMEVYLNVAETGPMTFGVEAGAKKWYGRPASQMTAEQGTRLICLLPSPRKWTPQSSNVKRRAARLLEYEIVLPEGVRRR
jgi:monofunctional biosynthetic peptidoglycan transglycosylase